jgi:hypothetical protein
MQIGTIAAVTIDTAILASSHDPGEMQALLFAVAAALILATLLVVARVPDHSGSW